MFVIKAKEGSKYIYWSESGGWTDWLYQAKIYQSYEEAEKFANRLLSKTIITSALTEPNYPARKA